MKKISNIKYQISNKYKFKAFCHCEVALGDRGNLMNRDYFVVPPRNDGRRSHKGFTLIELLVVIAIIGILSISGIAAFVNYNKSQTLNTAALEVVTILQNAKSRAQSQVKPKVDVCLGENNILKGYRVDINPDNKYELFVVCERGHSVIEEKSLPGDLKFVDSDGKSIIASQSFLFSTLSGTAQAGTVSISGYGQTKYIDITTTGVIAMLAAAPTSIPTPTAQPTLEPTVSPTITPTPSLVPTPTQMSTPALPANVALNKSANQSSTYDSYTPASLAVNGSTGGAYNTDVTITGYALQAWWEVDLGGNYSISSIVVYNRSDCCQERLSNFDITVLNGAASAWTQYVAGSVGSSMTFSPGGSVGNKVKIQLRGTNYLQLGEVVVIGIPNP